jgi:phenylacetate-CoA ligase
MKRALSKKNLWEKMPSWGKAVLGRGLGVVPLPCLLGRRFRGNFAFVRDAQWWPAERAREYQLNRLREIVRLAYEHTQFYRRTLDKVGCRPEDLRSLDDLTRLPTIDKSVVIENLSDMCARTIEAGDVDYMSTGSTSGKPLQFYIDASRSAVEYAYLTTSWERAGYRLGMPMAVLRGRMVKPNREGFYHEYDPILRHHHYSSFHMSDENLGRYLEHVATIGPCFLHVYPSTAAALARFCRRVGVRPPENIRGIIAESEIVYHEQRKMVEAVFGCRYLSCYGHSEKLVLAAECEHSDDYHVWPTYGYFEVLDDSGKPVTTPGQRGEIVGTGFINTVMPFIRYRTGDWATYVSDRCEACGREHPIIRDIRGHRTQEVLIAADGSEISWTALNMHDDTFLHVRQFQFMQEKPGQAVLRVVPADGFHEEDAGRIQRNLGRKLDGQLTFSIELVDAVALSPGGKAIYVDQRIPREKRALLDRKGDTWQFPHDADI